MSASFHLPEKGIEHQAAMPNIVAPSQLQPFSKIFADFAEKFGIQARVFYHQTGLLCFIRWNIMIHSIRESDRQDNTFGLSPMAQFPYNQT